MLPVMYFILGFGAAAVVVYFLMRRARKESAASQADGKIINPEQVKKREENLGRIVGYMGVKGQAANNDIEKLLGVSNATAERYLNELEKDGKIVQVGATGRDVFYRLK